MNFTSLYPEKAQNQIEIAQDQLKITEQESSISKLKAENASTIVEIYKF